MDQELADQRFIDLMSESAFQANWTKESGEWVGERLVAEIANYGYAKGCGAYYACLENGIIPEADPTDAFIYKAVTKLLKTIDEF